MTFRSLIFWPHLIAGVSAGLVILLMSITGVLLTYERQMIAWSDSDYRSEPASAGQAPLPIETVIATFERAHTELAVSAVTVGAAPDAPVAVAVERRTFYVNAYTGTTLGESSPTVRAIMSELRAWHRWIAVEGAGRPVARAITGWSNLLFLFIVASGFYLWFPRKWTWPNVRNVTVFRGGLRGKARDFNWHNAIGVWSAIPLFIVVLSALPISFPWFTNMVYQAVGEEPPVGGRGRGPAGRAAGPGPGGERNEAPPRPTADGMNHLLARAQRQEPEWRSIDLRLPTSGDGPVSFAIDRGDGGQPQLRSTLTLDRAGEVVSYETFAGQSPGRRLRSLMRFAHTGEVLGIPGQTLAGLVSAGGVVLVWTGLALAWRRLGAWIRQRNQRAVAVPTDHERPSTRLVSESHS